MDTNKVYEKFLQKLDSVGTQSIAVDKGSFCFMFNEAMNKEVEFFIKNKNDEDIRYLQKILNTKEILPTDDKKLYRSFALPTDYFTFSSAIGVASNDICKNVTISLYEIKNQNKDVILSDEYSKPSFKYRECPFYIGNDSLNVYVDDSFDLQTVILDYYRYPVQIRLIDEDVFESPFDDNYRVEFDAKLVDRIITTAVSDFQISIKDGTYRVNRERAIQKL